MPTSEMEVGARFQNKRLRALRVCKRLFWVVILILALTGCVTLKDPEASQDNASVVVATLEPGQTFGQSFVSRRPRLNGITLWVGVPSENPQGASRLILSLSDQPDDPAALATVELPLGTSGSSGPVDVSLPVQNDPGGQAYYLKLLSTSGTVQVFGRGEDGYAQGEADLDGTQLPGDIAFRLSYEYGWAAAWEDLAAGLRQIWLLFPLAGVLLLPGWMLGSLAPGTASASRPAGIAVTLGLSMALIPLLMAWTSAAGLAWTRLGWLSFTAGMIAILLWQLRDTRPRTWRISVHDLVLLTIFLGALAVRLMMVRDLAAPAWVDSVHHGLITRLILEKGAFPDSYLPYMDNPTASYHPGFHSLLASFLWLSGMSLADGMQLFGQVLNAGSVLAVYLFTMTLTKNRIASLAAAALTGFFSPMPAYYASWGRYTHLAGLLLMPVAYAWVRWVYESEQSRSQAEFVQLDWRSNLLHKSRWSRAALAAIPCAGLVLMHFRVAVFFACLLIADFAIGVMAEALHRLKTPILSRLGERNPALIRQVAGTGLAAFASLLLLSPWLAPFMRSMISTRSIVLAPAPNNPPLFNGFSWAFLTSAQGTTTLYLAGLGLLISLWKKPRFALTMMLWIAILFLVANLGALGIMREYINNQSVEIGLFLPITALGGYAIGQVADWLRRPLPDRWHRMYYFSLLGLGAFVSWMAARQLVTILNPVTFLARQSDWPALAWIQEHIPQEETILINPFAWGYGLYAGNDGGFWISPISGRRTLPPAVIYGFDSDRERVKSITRTSQLVINFSAEPEKLRALLLEEGIRYIYIGARGGVLSPAKLQRSPGFSVLYHQDTTWVFQVK